MGCFDAATLLTASVRFYAAATPKSQPRGAAYALRAGTQWAQRAKQLLFMSLNSPTPETIMVSYPVNLSTERGWPDKLVDSNPPTRA